MTLGTDLFLPLVLLIVLALLRSFIPPMWIVFLLASAVMAFATVGNGGAPLLFVLGNVAANFASLFFLRMGLVVMLAWTSTFSVFFTLAAPPAVVVRRPITGRAADSDSYRGLGSLGDPVRAASAYCGIRSVGFQTIQPPFSTSFPAEFGETRGLLASLVEQVNGYR